MVDIVYFCVYIAINQSNIHSNVHGVHMLSRVQEIEAVSQVVNPAHFIAPVGLMTLEKFAEAVGLPPGVVLGHLNRGMLPTVTLGRRRLINVVALQRELGRREFAL